MSSSALPVPALFVFFVSRVHTYSPSSESMFAVSLSLVILEKQKALPRKIVYRNFASDLDSFVSSVSAVYLDPA
ncbi:hypothetical protein F4775DRAFT_550031 [Biscogniauxia sp. FL1348]|nr:hypothetical protein F4775DRAFT_550031 [Biscogniauxia sp. FL1348]